MYMELCIIRIYLNCHWPNPHDLTRQQPCQFARITLSRSGRPHEVNGRITSGSRRQVTSSGSSHPGHVFRQVSSSSLAQPSSKRRRKRRSLNNLATSSRFLYRTTTSTRVTFCHKFRHYQSVKQIRRAILTEIH